MKRAVALRAFGIEVLTVALVWVGPVDAPAGNNRAGAGTGPISAEPNGWAVAFASDFSGTTLPTGCQAFDGAHPGASATHYRPDDVSVAGGLLRLSIRRRDFAGRPYTSGGMGCFGQDQQYGRYEFSAKAPLGTGLDSYATLWPIEAGVDRDTSLVEILAQPGNERLYLSNEYGLGESHTDRRGRYSDRFHTYTIEWAPNGYRVFVDGNQEMADSLVSSRRKWFGFAISTGDALTGLPDSSTVLPATFEVDWMRVWSYDPSAIGSIPGAQGGVSPAPGNSAPAPRSSDGGAAGGWSGRLAIVAVGALALALVAVAVRLRRPRRRPDHRA